MPEINVYISEIKMDKSHDQCMGMSCFELQLEKTFPGIYFQDFQDIMIELLNEIERLRNAR